MGVPLTEIVQFLDELLDIERIPDDSLNGLQVDGGSDVSRIAAAVDSDLRSIEAAAEAGAGLLIVHHGLFWKRQQRVLRGPEYRRIKALMDADLAVYAAHLPLDAHPTLGNNAVLADKAGLRAVEPWGEYKGTSIGMSGTLESPIGRGEIATWAKKLLGEVVQVIDTGPDEIRTVAVCSGAAAELAEVAHDDGFDLFITGEPRHGAMHRIRESGQNVLFLGHHASERGGPQALGATVAEKFDLPWDFVDSPSGA